MTRPHMRKPRTRAQLLPLAAGIANRLSMEHHISLALFGRAQGSFEHFGVLVRTVYMTWLIARAEGGCVSEVEPFLAADGGSGGLRAAHQ